MDDKSKDFLIKKLEPNIVSLFLINGYGLLDKQNVFTFNNFIPNKELVKKLYDNSNIILSDKEFIQSLLDSFPDGYSSKEPLITKRLEKFFQETSLSDITKEEILTCARNHVLKYEAPYFGKLEYFVYKVNENKKFTSRLEDAIIALRKSKIVEVNDTNRELGFNSSSNGIDDIFILEE